METELKKAKQHVEHLENGRSSWDDLNKLVAKYIIPRKGRHERGAMANYAKRPTGVIMDSKATRALRILKAGMQGGLTPPSNTWFRIGLVDKEYMEFGPARAWLDLVQSRIEWVLHKSNFYPCMHDIYGELGGFGSGCMYSEPHWQTYVNFKILTNGEFAWGANMYGKIDTNVRRFQMTCKQLVERFGAGRVSDFVKKQININPYEFVEVVHLIRPRRLINPERMDRLNMPWQSLWYEDQNAKSFLHEGGYRAFPIMASRWDITGEEVYGRGPAHDILPDVKMLQEVVRQQLLAIQKLVNPPMRVPNNYKKRLSHIPGGQTEVSVQNPDAIAPLYQVQPDITAISNKILDLRQAILEGFFNDLFQMFSNMDKSGVTATEVLQKQQEKMLILGPVIERQQEENLKPAIERVYTILQDKGMIPEPPQEIAGLEMEIEYTSSLAVAQKMSKSQSMLTLLTLVGQAAQADPNVIDKVNWDQVVDEYAMMTGAPASIIRSDREVEQIRAARAQAQARAQQAEMAIEAAKAVPSGINHLSQAYVQGQPALDRAMEALPQ